MMMKRFSSFQVAIAAAVALVAAFALPMFGQELKDAASAQAPIKGYVDDWSTHHFVYSNPGAEDEAIQNGSYYQWLQIVREPRYIMQQMKRSSSAMANKENEAARESIELDREVRLTGRGPVAEKQKLPKINLKEDWSEPLSTGAVLPNTYPAKWSFNPIGTASCSDFVVYPTGSAGSSTSATIIAYTNIYAGTGSCTTTNPSIYWAYDTGSSATVSTSPILSTDGTQVAFIQTTSSGSSLVLLKWATNNALLTTTATISKTSPEVTTGSGILSSSDVGRPISGTGIPVGDTIASVTGTTQANLTVAPTTAGSGVSISVYSQTMTTPLVPSNSASFSTYRSCTPTAAVPCMWTVSLGSSVTDTLSSPYYDYATDELYVAGATSSASELIKITGVFSGTTQTLATATLDSSSPGVPASPVYDPVSGCVFVGDSNGYLYSVNSGNGSSGSVCKSASFGTVVASEQLAGGTSEGIVDAPLVDSTAQTVYIFVADSAKRSAGRVRAPLAPPQNRSQYRARI